jgi:hypothetical protein
MNNNHKSLRHELTQILAPIADRHGEFLYSAVSCLRPSDVYLLGYNPGQGGPNTSIGEHLVYSLDRTDNAWLDEKWIDGKRPSPLQRRVWKLFEDAGLDLRATPASNLIFATSPDASGVDYKLADICWPAHQVIMNIVQPSRLIVFGNGESESPYAFIRSRYPGNEERFAVRRGYILKRLTTVIDGRPTKIIGIPHMSRFAPNPEAVEWLRV